jgi:HlyD family secretion protein
VRLGALVSANVVTYTVIITARNDSQALMPGMTANLAILLGHERGVLKLPNQTLTFRPPAGYGGTESESNNQQSGQSRGGGGGFGPPGGGGGRPPWMNNNSGDAQGQRGSASGGSSPPAIRMLRELELADDQREKVREQMQALFQNGGPPEPRAMAQRLRSILTKEQQTKLDALIAAEESGRQPESRTATIWVRDGKNELKSVEVQVGISDSEYTHLLGGGLGEGDLVVVRVERKSS